MPKPPRLSDAQLDKEVLFVLKQYVGHSQPIGRWTLVEKIYSLVACVPQDDSNPYDRQIRDSVNRLRKRGELICDMADGRGRYMARSWAEYHAFNQRHGARAYDVLETLSAMEAAARSAFQAEYLEWKRDKEQPSLFGNMTGARS
jgi:hypothetical protein